MLVRATWPFYMVKGGHIYEVGETYDATDAEAERLVRRGLAEVVEAADDADADEAAEGQDVGSLTVSQLKALCDERGVAYPKKVTKAQLLELLGE